MISPERLKAKGFTKLKFQIRGSGDDIFSERISVSTGIYFGLFFLFENSEGIDNFGKEICDKT